MLATSIGGKFRGEETGACATGTSSVVSKAATRGDIGLPTSEPRAESGELSLSGRDLGALCAADAGCARGGAINSVSGTRSVAEGAKGTGCVAGADCSPPERSASAVFIGGAALAAGFGCEIASGGCDGPARGGSLR